MSDYREGERRDEIKWRLGYSASIEAAPDELATAWTPSDVQLVWKAAKFLPDYNYGQNYKLYSWMEDVYWHYSAEITVERDNKHSQFLCFESIDYKYSIFVNGEYALSGEGMFTPVKLPLDDYAGTTAAVEVIIHPIPKAAGMPEDRNQAKLCAKPAVSYGWDWHPRLVPSGISGHVRLVRENKHTIEENDFLYEVSDDLSRVEYKALIRCKNPAGRLVVRIFDAEGGLAAESGEIAAEVGNELSLTLLNPRLWWCARQGEQYLYSVTALLLGENGEILAESTRKIGFRRVRLVMNDENWDGGGFPNTQARFPMTLELNNRKIFCKGSNFVPPEIFYSRMTPSVYRDVLIRASEANMNMLRVWGGGLVNRESFFELCDELGIMVWQEFPLACNNYPDDEHYLRVLDRESASIIKRLKAHPCVTLWCGGNELFCGWSCMTNQSLALRLLDKNTLEHDPKTPFIMTSPLYGVGHGHYLALARPDYEAVSLFADSPRTAYTEFGSPSVAPFWYIKNFIPEDELYSVEDGTSWEDHHALHAWCDKYTWYRPDEIAGYYGKSSSLEEEIERSMTIQAASYKGLFEEARRKWPATSMALNWCYNEPWPCFANNSLLVYPAIPKPAYYAVKEALRDRMLSLKLYKLRYKKGESLKVSVYALNDLPDTMSGGHYRVRLNYADKLYTLGEGEFGAVGAVSSVELEAFELVIPDDITPTASLTVECTDSALNSVYTLFFPPVTE